VRTNVGLVTPDAIEHVLARNQRDRRAARHGRRR
jgi:hypothetical protein